jgi:serine/threonine protein kinase
MLSDRYRLERKLGHGGMGVVYGATDVVMRRPVAIKLISPDPLVEEEAASRFLREARNTARIHHPNIVHVFDLGRSSTGDLFFVMELLDGESLSQRLRKVSHFSAEVSLHVGAQICSALAHAHENGIVHRDLKPANVMLVPTGDDPHFAKVLDFGVAKAQDQGTQLTRTGMLVGTVEYMAPEQIMGRPVDARTDIYALGVILYRMLTGTPLFRDGGSAQLIHQHINEIPEPLRKRAPAYDIPQALEAVVLRCLAKRPEGRFASMRELGDALERLLQPGALSGSMEVDPSPSWQPTFVEGQLRNFGPPSGATDPATVDPFDDSMATQLARRPEVFSDGEPAEPTRVEGLRRGLSGAVPLAPGSQSATRPNAAPPARRDFDVPPLVDSTRGDDDASFDAPQTLVLPGQVHRATFPSVPDAFVRSAPGAPFGSPSGGGPRPGQLPGAVSTAAQAGDPAVHAGGARGDRQIVTLEGLALRRRRALPYWIAAFVVMSTGGASVILLGAGAESLIALGVAILLSALLAYLGLRARGA